MNFSSTKFVSTALALGLGSSLYAAEKPNVILINIDDLGWSDLGVMGSDYYQTPNIDKLAKQGVIFNQGYAAAANCAPSRACLISGQATPHHGVYTVLNSDRGKSSTRKIIPTKNTIHLTNENASLGRMMKSAGYVTATMGKWHVTKNPLKNGFDINVGGTQAGGPYNGGYHSPFKYPDCEVKEKGTYLTDYLTTRAISFIDDNKEKPFFLYFPYFAVHTPIQGKKEKIEKYKKLPKGKGHNHPSYAAMIESVDENVGRLMAALDQMKLTENTMVIFTSDNGGVYSLSKQWPLRTGKGSYYEGGIRVPFFIRYPKMIQPNQVSEMPVTNLDIYPTLIELCGAPKAKKPLDGKSLMPFIKDQKELPKRPLFWHFPIYLQGGNSECLDPIFRTRPGSVIRFGDWKLIEYFEDGKLELYNLADDMSEKKDLAKSNPEMAQKLLAQLKDWRKEMNAPVPTKLNPDYGKKEPARKKKNKKKKK